MEFPSSDEVEKVAGKPVTIKEEKYKTNRPEMVLAVKQLTEKIGEY